MIKSMMMVLALSASAAEVPRRPTMWIVRVENVKGDFLIPISIAKMYQLKPGAMISLETARLIAEELGAVYPEDIKQKLEELGD